jgi:acyl phosphate:glycerol-3-phosphate acyltransferase
MTGFEVATSKVCQLKTKNENQKCRVKYRSTGILPVSNFFNLRLARRLSYTRAVPVAFAYILIVVAAYLLGSIPTGFLMAQAKGIDIRSVGSGNIGATNAMRVMGKPTGIFVLLLDALKGYAACTWLVSLELKLIAIPPGQVELLQIIAGIAAILGHNYTCWLKFKGGKGIATTAGVYLALASWALLIAFGVFILVVLVTRYVSLGSIAAAVALPTVVWCRSDNLMLEIVTTALGLMAILKHKKNLQRLMAGTENRLGRKVPAEVTK